jgi:hypothetical protein
MRTLTTTEINHVSGGWSFTYDLNNLRNLFRQYGISPFFIQIPECPFISPGGPPPPQEEQIFRN